MLSNDVLKTSKLLRVGLSHHVCSLASKGKEAALSTWSIVRDGCDIR